MLHSLMSSPLVQLYLFYVVAMLLICLWPSPSNLAVRDGPCEQSICLPRTAACGPGPFGCWFPGAREDRELSAFRDLAAACAAEYSARFSPRIKQVRKW
jgi:hypothetical protein